MFDRITFDTRILGGRASIRGMRIPVSVIVGQIAHGAGWDEVLADYPDLEPEDIQQALSYAAWLAQGLHDTRTEHVIERLQTVLDQSSAELLAGAIVVVEEGRHRVRKLPIGS
jgi:uncharacterized protein (DUF433 family)